MSISSVVSAVSIISKSNVDILRLIFEYGNYCNMQLTKHPDIKDLTLERSYILKIIKTINIYKRQYNLEFEYFNFISKYIKKSSSLKNINIEHKGSIENHNPGYGLLTLTINMNYSLYFKIQTDINEKALISISGSFYDESDYKISKEENKIILSDQVIKYNVSYRTMNKLLLYSTIKLATAIREIEYPTLPIRDNLYWGRLPKSLKKENQRWYVIELKLRFKKFKDRNNLQSLRLQAV